jgi:hypothetical protein
MCAIPQGIRPDGPPSRLFAEYQIIIRAVCSSRFHRSISSCQSFEEVITLRQQILRAKKMKNFPVITVGDRFEEEAERRVSKQEGENLARSMGCSFIEASSKVEFVSTERFMTSSLRFGDTKNEWQLCQWWLMRLQLQIKMLLLQDSLEVDDIFFLGLYRKTLPKCSGHRHNYYKLAKAAIPH